MFALDWKIHTLTALLSSNDKLSCTVCLRIL